MITKQEFDSKISSGLTSIQKIWMNLCGRTECIYCSQQFEDGLLKKHPGEQQFPLDAHFWFTPNYLVHLQTTHGYSPEVMDLFLQELNAK